jgi:hypothetical protein
VRTVCAILLIQSGLLAKTLSKSGKGNLPSLVELSSGSMLATKAKDTAPSSGYCSPTLTATAAPRAQQQQLQHARSPIVNVLRKVKSRDLLSTAAVFMRFRSHAKTASDGGSSSASALNAATAAAAANGFKDADDAV